MARTVGLVPRTSLVGLATKASVPGLAVPLSAVTSSDGNTCTITALVTAVVLAHRGALGTVHLRLHFAV